MPPSSVTEVELLEFHVRVVDCPLVTSDGDADREIVGAGAGGAQVWVALIPPFSSAPVQRLSWDRMR